MMKRRALSRDTKQAHAEEGEMDLECNFKWKSI